MWDSPITESQIKALQKLGCQVMQTATKMLACGEVGPGALLPIKSIVD